MSHWTCTSYNTTAKARNHMSNTSGNKELDCIFRQYNPTSGLEASRSVKRLREIKSSTFEIMNDNLGTSLSNLRNEGLGCQYISMASHRTNGGSSSKAEHGQGAEEELGPPFGRFAVSKPSQEYLARSSSYIMPSGFDNKKHEINKGKTAISLFIDLPPFVNDNQLANASPRNLTHEPSIIHRKSAFLVYGRQMDGHSQLGSSINGRFRESNIPMSPDLPYMSDDHLSAFGRECFQKMQKISGMRPFPSHSSDSEKTELKKSQHDCYSLENSPNCVDNLETMRICTTVDSVGEPGGHSRFSQTTHSLFITKRTANNLSKENDIVRDRRVFTESNGNKTSDFLELSPYYSQSQRGVHLQALDSSTDNEGKENVTGVKAS